MSTKIIVTNKETKEIKTYNTMKNASLGMGYGRNYLNTAIMKKKKENKNYSWQVIDKKINPEEFEGEVLSEKYTKQMAERGILLRAIGNKKANETLKGVLISIIVNYYPIDVYENIKTPVGQVARDTGITIDDVRNKANNNRELSKLIWNNCNGVLFIKDNFGKRDFTKKFKKEILKLY